MGARCEVRWTRRAEPGEAPVSEDFEGIERTSEPPGTRC